MFRELKEDQLHKGTLLISRNVDTDPEVDHNPDLRAKHLARIIAETVGRGGRKTFVLSTGGLWESDEIIRSFRQPMSSEAGLVAGP